MHRPSLPTQAISSNPLPSSPASIYDSELPPTPISPSPLTISIPALRNSPPLTSHHQEKMRYMSSAPAVITGCESSDWQRLAAIRYSRANQTLALPHPLPSPFNFVGNYSGRERAVLTACPLLQPHQGHGGYVPSRRFVCAVVHCTLYAVDCQGCFSIVPTARPSPSPLHCLIVSV